MEIIDNINTLLGDDFKINMKPGSHLKIAASCFSIYAYEALKDELGQIESLEFIFTSPTFIPEEVTDKSKRERREYFIPKAERERCFFGTEFEIALKNKLNQRAIAKECAEWIRSKAKFRSNASQSPMQQWAYLESEDGPTAYTPIQGFTAVDLGYQKGNAISNFVNKMTGAQNTSAYMNLFDQIWQDQNKLQDVTKLLCDHIEKVYQENSPERIYFFILYNIFNEFLEDLNEDLLPNDKTGYKESVIWKKLFNFQKDAAVGLINKLETYNGCILADSVGLGKTFTALAVIKYYELRNRSVLVLCPKKLTENWMTFNRNLTTNTLIEDRLRYDVLCHTDLLRTSGESFGMPMNQINWGNYDLVVIDESHNFRNNDIYKEKETRYQKLINSVVKAGVKTKVLMLSATPVNNRFNDLHNQLKLAYEDDSEAFNEKLDTEKGVDEIFRRAQKVFNRWTELPPNERTADTILNQLDFDFFKLLDNVTIARSRRHVQTFYDTSEIGAFPDRLKPISHHCPLTYRNDVMGFNAIYKELSCLKLSIYAPVSYILPSRLRKYEELYDTIVGGGKGKLRQADRERGLKALMTTNLLKRLESSVESFRLTLGKLEAHIRQTLEKIARYDTSGTDEILSDPLTGIDIDELDDEALFPEELTIGSKVRIRLDDMDLITWGRELRDDLMVIEDLLREMGKVTPEEDAKLQHLKDQIELKLNNPINEGNKKILIFTAFSDTAKYLYKQLTPTIQGCHGLHGALITGTDAPQSTLPTPYDFQSILTLFSPASKSKDLILPNEPLEIDILFATDCISEGQNLQDCDTLINYDIHWNPVRIIQRFGRIDRIGSINKCIQLVNYWPDLTLDEYINLKERVEDRMVIADVTATGDDNVLKEHGNDVTYRKEQLRRLKEEVIELEDVKSGVSIMDLGLNDFRMDLLSHIKTNGELSELPNGLHAVVPATIEPPRPPGVIFALRNRNHGININQQNRLHPYYIIYMKDSGEVAVNHTDVKHLLDLMRLACRGETTPIESVCTHFNEATDDGRNMAFYSGLLDEAVAAMVTVKEQRDMESLFSGIRTTALEHTITGLDDFELIAFIVVQEQR